MAIQLGEDFVIKVETATPGTFVVLNDMNRYGINNQRSTTKIPVFSRATPYSIAGARDRSWQISGLFNPADAGYLRLLNAEINNTPLKVQFLYDGTNGFQQEVVVSSFTMDNTPDGVQEIGFQLDAYADATIVGTGPLI